ncbi:MAG: flagellar hook-basal body complex protein FliE [Actinobacteria bacterium]|nr:flagellar hook-basal body complex protein FliE [Actinomycetota bacterium]
MTIPISAVSKAAEQIALGPQQSVEPTKSTGSADPAGGFGSMLTNAIGDLEKTQNAAATQAQELATGQTNDISSVVTAVQEAQLSMQLASQVRNKAVEAYTEIFHTQI